jgi:hypothetical protein
MPVGPPRWWHLEAPARSTQGPPAIGCSSDRLVERIGAWSASILAEQVVALSPAPANKQVCRSVGGTASTPTTHAVVVSPAPGERRRVGVCRKKPSTRAAFRGRESKLRGGQRFLFQASKIRWLLTRIAKAERVTIKPTVKWLLFTSASRTYSRPVSGSV